jgi:hypothetical protein
VGAENKLRDKIVDSTGEVERRQQKERNHALLEIVSEGLIFPRRKYDLEIRGKLLRQCFLWKGGILACRAEERCHHEVTGSEAEYSCHQVANIRL